MEHTEYLIIGGGPAGLGAAWRLQEKGLDWHLLEAEDHFGGLASSFVDEQGFTWDLGGHVQFSHYETFDRHMDLVLGKDGWLHHERESWIWVRQRFVPYPFQYNLHRLDPADRDRCVEDLRKAAGTRDAARPANFGEWMLATFGQGICDLFMRPYNEKVWAYPPEQMDSHWIDDRVAVPKVEEVLDAVRTGKDHLSWGPNRTFRFPVRGGTGSIWTASGQRLPKARISLSTAVERIDVSRRVVLTRCGAKWKYRHLISTMPLDELIRIAPGPVPAETADRLVFSSTHLVGIGVEGQPSDHLKTKCWMYFPQSNNPCYRITVFSNYSPNNVALPGEQWSLMGEVSESRSKPVDQGRVVEDCVRAVEEDRLLPDRGRACSLAYRRIPRAYPTPFLGRDGVVDPVLRHFEEHGIYSRGRFGAWKYEVSNQDHSFAQGYECSERLCRGGGPEWEPTLHQPAAVNSRRNP